jgi:hypothetical protein
LQTLDRRFERGRRGGIDRAFPEAFHHKRMAQAQRSRILGGLLIPFDAGFVIPLRRAPDVRVACAEALGECAEACVISLRELLGMIGAHEWRKKGMSIPALGARIHPHYGVFSPMRGEYPTLLAGSPARWPASAATSKDWDWAAQLKSSRPTCFRWAARRSSSAILPGCRANQARLGARIRHLRSWQPHAARLSRQTRLVFLASRQPDKFLAHRLVALDFPRCSRHPSLPPSTCLH